MFLQKICYVLEFIHWGQIFVKSVRKLGNRIGILHMKRELGIARCGLACCLCSENITCHGCNSGECPDKDWCENRKCSILKKFGHCYDCKEICSKGLFK